MQFQESTQVVIFLDLNSSLVCSVCSDCVIELSRHVRGDRLAAGKSEVTRGDLRDCSENDTSSDLLLGECEVADLRLEYELDHVFFRCAARFPAVRCEGGKG